MNDALLNANPLKKQQEESKHLVTKLMNPDPSARYKGKQIMQHQWMKMDLSDTSKYLKSNNNNNNSKHKRSRYSQKTQIMSQNNHYHNHNHKRYNNKDKMSLLSHNTTDVPMKSNTNTKHNNCKFLLAIFL